MDSQEVYQGMLYTLKAVSVPQVQNQECWQTNLNYWLNYWSNYCLELQDSVRIRANNNTELNRT